MRYGPDPGQFCCGGLSECDRRRTTFAGSSPVWVPLLQGGTDGGELKNTDGTIEIPVDQALAGFSILFELEGKGAVELVAPGRRDVRPDRGQRKHPGCQRGIVGS